MIGPSGFFLPTGPGDIRISAQDIELIHRSEDGFNELYRVCKNGRFFVYKALKQELRDNIMYEDLLTKDFNIGFSLSHSGICQYFAKIKHPLIGNCIVMEWIDGRTLEDLICKGKIDSRLARKIICEICDALDYMHHKQVIHRDLKPENILITHNGQNIKIIDFGLSDTDSYSSFKSPAGTRIYASPEQIAGEHIDIRSDLWSLGLIINEISRKYRHVASRCLRREKEKRYSSAAEVKDNILRESARKVRITVIWCIAALAIATATIMLTVQPERSGDIKDKGAIADDNVVTNTNSIPEAAEQTYHRKEDKQESLERVTKTRPAVESGERLETENINAEELEELFNDAAQSIL